jgi:hypothetical protein
MEFIEKRNRLLDSPLKPCAKIEKPLARRALQWGLGGAGFLHVILLVGGRVRCDIGRVGIANPPRWFAASSGGRECDDSRPLRLPCARGIQFVKAEHCGSALPAGGKVAAQNCRPKLSRRCATLSERTLKTKHKATYDVSGNRCMHNGWRSPQTGALTELRYAPKPWCQWAWIYTSGP